MPADVDSILAEFAAAITAGSAEVMIGAGLSAGAGYPDWSQLLAPLRKSANVPAQVTDSPLVAEYIAHEMGRSKFDEALLKGFRPARSPAVSHHLLGQLGPLGLRSVWTTNYDCLIEDVFPSAYRIFNDNDYAHMRRVVRNGRVTKIHGSIGVDKNGVEVWTDRPVITRSDYEGYQRDHPILWADLQARFLTNTFLFLGFSFNDPNIEVLLRLSRSLDPRMARAPHFALMRREDKQPDQRLQDLRVRDLEGSGIEVGYIHDYGHIPLFLRDLRRRCLPPALFVSGPKDPWEERQYSEIAEVIQGVAPRLALISMGAPPANHLGRALTSVRHRAEANDPELIKCYHEYWADDQEVPHPMARTGTAIYTDLDREALLRSLLGRSTAFLRVARHLAEGRSRPSQEMSEALEQGIPAFDLDPSHLSDLVGGFNTARGQVMITSHLDAFRIWLEDVFGDTPASPPGAVQPEGW